MIILDKTDEEGHIKQPLQSKTKAPVTNHESDITNQKVWPISSFIRNCKQRGGSLLCPYNVQILVQARIFSRWRQFLNGCATLLALITTTWRTAGYCHWLCNICRLDICPFFFGTFVAQFFLDICRPNLLDICCLDFRTLTGQSSAARI